MHLFPDSASYLDLSPVRVPLTGLVFAVLGTGATAALMLAVAMIATWTYAGYRLARLPGAIMGACLASSPSVLGWSQCVLTEPLVFILLPLLLVVTHPLAWAACCAALVLTRAELAILCVTAPSLRALCCASPALGVAVGFAYASPNRIFVLANSLLNAPFPGAPVLTEPLTAYAGPAWEWALRHGGALTVANFAREWPVLPVAAWPDVVALDPYYGIEPGWYLPALPIGIGLAYAAVVGRLRHALIACTWAALCWMSDPMERSRHIWPALVLWHSVLIPSWATVSRRAAWAYSWRRRRGGFTVGWRTSHARALAVMLRAGVFVGVWVGLILLAEARQTPFAWEQPIRDGERWAYGELLEDPGRAVFPGLVEIAAKFSFASAVWDTVRWNDGLRARPRTLFFSLPVVATLKLWPQTSPIAVMRGWAMGAMLATLLILWTAVRRGTGSAFGADAAALSFLCWPVFWHYGSYGSAVAGTLCAGALVLGAALLCVRDPTLGRMAWLLLTGFVATLQYAPARVVVLGLLVVVVLRAWRHWHLVGALLLGVCAIAWMQGPGGRHAFLNGSGEQVIYGTHAVPLDPEVWVRVPKLIEQNLPQFAHLFGPWTGRVLDAGGTENIVGIDAGTPLLPAGWVVVAGLAGALTACAWGVPLAMLPYGFLLACLLTSGPDLARTSLCALLWAMQIGLAVAVVARMMGGENVEHRVRGGGRWARGWLPARGLGWRRVDGARHAPIW